jgi:hypothetical protein
MRPVPVLHAMSRRDRRAVSLGALVIAGTLAVARGVPALQQWSETSVASAREAVAEDERARRSVSGARTLADTMRVRSERFVALAPALLDGKSAATAGATLASIVSGAAAASDAKLGSVQLRADTAARDSSGAAGRAFTRVAVRASLTADVRGLSRFLLALERGLTLLSIDELSITQPEPGADGTRPEMLQVELVVAGLALTARRSTR